MGDDEGGSACDLSGLVLSPRLTETMRYSLHPPHAFEDGGAGLPVPSPAFPVCRYDGQDDDPASATCRSFQTTFNDYGLCYTFNNVRLGGQADAAPAADAGHGQAFFRIRRVHGCGKKRGFQLAVDSHRLATAVGRAAGGRRKRSGGAGFKVFITAPGGVTSKVGAIFHPFARSVLYSTYGLGDNGGDFFKGSFQRGSHLPWRAQLLPPRHPPCQDLRGL